MRKCNSKHSDTILSTYELCRSVLLLYQVLFLHKVCQPLLSAYSPSQTTQPYEQQRTPALVPPLLFSRSSPHQQDTQWENKRPHTRGYKPTVHTRETPRRNAVTQLQSVMFLFLFLQQQKCIKCQHLRLVKCEKTGSCHTAGNTLTEHKWLLTDSPERQA